MLYKVDLDPLHIPLVEWVEHIDSGDKKFYYHYSNIGPRFYLDGSVLNSNGTTIRPTTTLVLRIDLISKYNHKLRHLAVLADYTLIQYNDYHGLVFEFVKGEITYRIDSSGRLTMDSIHKTAPRYFEESVKYQEQYEQYIRRLRKDTYNE